MSAPAYTGICPPPDFSLPTPTPWLVCTTAVRRLALALVALPLACGGEDPPDFGPPAQTGSVTVTWDLVDAAGEAVTCGSLGVAEAVVSGGGEPQTVACGDDQRAAFTGLVPQRYPVVIRLRGLAGSGILGGDWADNVVVEGGKTIEYAHTFEFDEAAGNTGALRAKWTIEGMPAATGCAVVGGDRVAVETQPGSIADFAFTAACEDGEYLQSNLRPGNYIVRLRLQDPAGADLSVRESTYRVSRSDTADAEVSFSVVNRPRADLLVTWTVTGSAAAEACREDWSVRLRLAQDLPPNLEVATATAACADGAHRIANLLPPRNPEADRYRVSVFLEEPLRGLLDTQLVTELQLLSARTTTVAVDLTPGE